MLRIRVGTGLVMALAVLLMSAATGMAAPKDGKYVGEVGSGATAEKIVLKVDGKRITGKLCGRAMSGDIKGSKFSAAYRGPGGVYLGVDGKFPTSKKAVGVVTTDYNCDPSTKDVHFSARLKG
jgi:hypothetical protein